MIVWLNGAFGAGKSQAARELLRRSDGGVTSDPELPGFGMHGMLPRDLRGDFQDFPAWRQAVREVLGRLAAHRPLVIVPMTLIEHHDEIVGGLRADGVEVRHVVLDASPDVLRARLRHRGAVRRKPETWALAQVDRCVAGLAALPGTHVPTDGRAPDAIVEDVAAAVGVDLVRPPRPRWRQRVERAVDDLRS